MSLHRFEHFRTGEASAQRQQREVDRIDSKDVAVHSLIIPRRAGTVIAVVLAALGMMMFPIFTVYITSLISHRRASSDADMALPQGLSRLHDALKEGHTLAETSKK